MASTIKPDAKICNSCAEARKEKGLSPIEMIVLPSRTSKKKLMIRVCPDCDGNIAELALRNHS